MNSWALQLAWIRWLVTVALDYLAFFAKSYSNPFRAMWLTTRGDYPRRLRLRNGQSVDINCRHDIFLFAANYQFVQRHKKFFSGNLFVWNGNRTIRMTVDLGNVDAASTIINGDFSELPVNGRTVVDIGANIGDTALYFADRGAKVVYALEPFPYSFRIALQNVELNGLGNRIILLNKGVGNPGTILVDENYKNTIGSTLQGSATGQEVDIVTLDQLVEQLRLKGAVLKMNCEGCEYPAILNASENALRAFSDIIIQFHDGYDGLKQKLVGCGFFVATQKVEHRFGLRGTKRYSLRGFLHAIRSAEELQ